MKHLLLVAHGSRRQASNDEVRALTQRLSKQTGDLFDSVDCGFLELAEPSIPDGIQQGIDLGADEVVVLPYFLSAGTHVAHDIPQLIAQRQQANPNVTIRLASYIGAADGMMGLLLDTAANT